MSESDQARRQRLLKALSARDAQLPPYLARLANTLWNETDEPEAHAECLDALPTFVTAEVEGQPAAKLYPRVQQHLDQCESCTTQYLNLLEVALADARGQLPRVDKDPKLDLSFLPPRRAPLPISRERQGLSESLAALLDPLRNLLLSPNIGRRAFAATGQAETGQSTGGTLRWRITRDRQGNLEIYLGSHQLELEGLGLQLVAGDQRWPVVLTRVSADQVGAEIKLTHEERELLPPEAPLRLQVSLPDSTITGPHSAA